MTAILRGGLYVLALLLFAIVYQSQNHSNAADTVRAALPMTGRMVLWSAAGIAVMLALEWAFID